MSKRSTQEFIQGGLKFACTACGKCCTNHSRYDFVYLTDQDIALISSHLKLSPSAFRKTYTKPKDGYRVLRDRSDTKGDCLFLKENGHCGIYPVRPNQCRTFPFWKENLNSKTWNTDLAKDCPGINQGETVSEETIRNFLEWDEKEEYPTD